jgi:1-acyl-sn-glycerol-3-phosphate acyltransferase
LAVVNPTRVLQAFGDTSRVLAGFGRATLLGASDTEASWQAAAVASRRALTAWGIEARVVDRTGLTREELRAGGHLFVHLDQQTLLSILLYPQVLTGPCSLVVNAEFAALPLFGWMTVAQRGVVIWRQRPAQAKRALQSVVRRLQHGENFGISIEGQRSKDGRLSPYKKGPAVLAIEAGATIVPFMTHGEWALWPRGSWSIRPGPVEIVAYPPIRTAGMTYADRDDLVATLRALAERERRERGLTV